MMRILIKLLIKKVTRVENSVASEKIITLSHLKMENYKRRMLKTEDNNATSDDQVTTTVNSQQLNTDNTTSNATMSAAPINVSKDDLKLIVKK